MVLPILKFVQIVNIPSNVCIEKKRFFEIDELYWNDLAATEWISGWKRNNWIKKTDSKPVLNKDLMIKIDELQEKVKVKWVYHTVNFLHLFVFFLFDLDLCCWSFIKSRQWCCWSFSESRCSTIVEFSLIVRLANLCLFFLSSNEIQIYFFSWKSLVYWISFNNHRNDRIFIFHKCVSSHKKLCYM